VLGALGGAALHATLTKQATPSSPVVVAPPPVASSAPEPTRTVSTESASPRPLPSAAEVDRPPRRATPASPRAPSPSTAPIATASAETPRPGDDLRQQRAELEVARAAVSRGDAAAALDALDRHTVAYPNSKLAEERAALRIHALVLAGRMDDARDSASDFRRRYPTSFLLPSIDRAIGR
jgi:outer membrane protein assembly factor BamD (BamD/ComL family)